MPPLEYGITAKELAQYSESFVAPKDKRYEVSKLLEECDGYEVVDSAIPLENQRENYTEYLFRTKSEGDVRLRHHGIRRHRYEYVNGNMQEMLKVESKLANTQSFELPKRRSKSGIHAVGMHFIVKNIDRIDEILTNNNGKRKTMRTPRWFIENDIPHPLKDDLKSDLILVGSDNRFRILEHGNNFSKQAKVKDYALGLQVLYERITQSHLPPNRIIPYVVKYGQEDDVFNLDLYPQDYN